MQVSRNECRQCRMVPAMAVQTRAEGSVPALLQPPGGPTLPCKALLCPCGTPRGGSPRPAACWGALHHTGQVQPLVWLHPTGHHRSHHRGGCIFLCCHGMVMSYWAVPSLPPAFFLWKLYPSKCCAVALENWQLCDETQSCSPVWILFKVVHWQSVIRGVRCGKGSPRGVLGGSNAGLCARPGQPLTGSRAFVRHGGGLRASAGPE